MEEIPSDKFPSEGEVSSLRLNRRDLASLLSQVDNAFQADSPADVQALLSGHHPDDVKEVLQLPAKHRGRWLTFLTKATLQRNTAMVRALLAVGADVNHETGFGGSALQIAFRLRDFEMVQLFLKSGATMDPTVAKGNGYLTEAARINAVEIAMYLLDSGADPNEKNVFGYTPLYEAIKAHNTGMVKLLVAGGADVNYAVENKTTPLLVASAFNCLDIAKFLVEKGARVDAENWTGMTCLMEACISERVAVAKFLLEAGVDPNEKTTCNQTALHLSAEVGAMEVTKLLVTKGADVNLTDTENCTALLTACKGDFAMVVQYLLDNGARTDITDKEGDNCLMVACRAGRSAVVKLLLSRDMDPNYKNLSHRTPLHEAALSNSKKVAQLLLDHGATLSADFSGCTPLVVAAFHQCVDVTQVLLESSSVKPLAKAEALELLAASCVRSSPQETYEYLYRAMKIRHCVPSHILLKPHRPPVAALGNVVESQTLQELESRRQDTVTLEWECLLAVERILGHHDFVHEHFIDTCYYLLEEHRFTEALALWVYLMMFPNTNALVSNDPFLDVLLSSYSPTFEESEQLLRAELQSLRGMQRAWPLEIVTCFRYVKSALQAAKNADERNQLKMLVQELIAAQSTWSGGMTYLYCAVTDNEMTEFSVPLVAFLLECGADVNATTFLGDTPLHCLVQRQDRHEVETVCRITRMLLEADFHLDLRNGQGSTVLDCAAMEEVRVVVREYWPVSLKCLAAEAVIQSGIPYQDGVPQMVQDFINMHKSGHP